MNNDSVASVENVSRHPRCTIWTQGKLCIVDYIIHIGLMIKISQVQTTMPVWIQLFSLIDSTKTYVILVNLHLFVFWPAFQRLNKYNPVSLLLV
jgi:hypothetical protein